MKDLFRQILEEMKDKVMHNLDAVKEHEGEIKKLSAQTETYARDFNLQMKRRLSRQILSDNLDYLELQLKILNFIDKYKFEGFMKMELPPIIRSGVDYFKETIEGNIEFNARHPFYRNEQFIDRLMQFYLSKEDYANCDKLAKLKTQEK